MKEKKIPIFTTYFKQRSCMDYEFDRLGNGTKIP